MNGIINVFKPKNMTSHDVVNILRKKTGIKRIGHTGTLDPMATGVLPICIGKATRVSEYLLNLEKEYVGELTLGSRTDTLDMEGEVIETSNKEVTRDDIISCMDKYIGTIEQTPPMYSALKHNGKKLYELAREGKTVERPKRKINIYKLDILSIEDNRKIIFKVNCSKGTYIRTLCDDIGSDLGTFGYMSYLMRTGSGSFEIQDSYSLDFIKRIKLEEIANIITPMDKALSHIESFTIQDRLYSKLVNGVKIKLDENIDFKEDKLYRVYCKNSFIGIGKISKEKSELYLKMNKVLIT